MTKDFIYGDLNFKFNNQEKVKTRVEDNAIYGKSLIIDNMNLNIETVQKITLSEKLTILN